MTSGRPLDPMGSLWDVIAIELRKRRTEGNLSLAAVGEIIKRDRSLVSLVESGEVRLQAAHARALDAAWKTGGLFTWLVHHAKTRHETSWVDERSDLESRSSLLRVWALAWVPGFFQTESYARATFTDVGVIEDVEAGVRARLSRRDSLNRTPRPIVRVILDQGVIDQPVGGAEVMREQLAYLMELAELHTIRIVPRSLGAHVGRDGPFQIMTVDGADSVYTQALGPGRLIQDLSEVGSYRLWFDRISDVAMPIRESVRLIRETMEGFR